MKILNAFALVALTCAVSGLAGCGTGSELESSPDTDLMQTDGTGTTDPAAVNVDELVRVEPEPGTVSAAACTHNSTQWVKNGCCTQTATKIQQQICIYGTWYWQTPYRCEYPTSYCLP